MCINMPEACYYGCASLAVTGYFSAFFGSLGPLYLRDYWTAHTHRSFVHIFKNIRHMQTRRRAWNVREKSRSNELLVQQTRNAEVQQENNLKGRSILQIRWIRTTASGTTGRELVHEIHAVQTLWGCSNCANIPESYCVPGFRLWCRIKLCPCVMVDYNLNSTQVTSRRDGGQVIKETLPSRWQSPRLLYPLTHCLDGGIICA